MSPISDIRHLIAEAEMSKAEDLCNTLLQVEDSAEGYHLLGYVAQQTGRHSLSIDCCRRANDLGLDDWSNHLILGLSHIALGQHDSACHAFEMAHSMSPSSIDAAIFFLKATFSTKGFEAAESVYQCFSRALLQGESGRVREFWRSLVTENQTATIRCLMRADRGEEAEIACRTLLKHAPNKNVHRLLGQIEHHNRWREYKLSRKPQLMGNGVATISVMLITYNHEKYIRQAINSILIQETEYEFEIVIIEDCSTDTTRDVIMEYVNKYPKKVKAFFNPTNIGTLDPPQQKVTHEGLKRLAGDYFAILEGDDYWSSPHKLQKQIAFLEANPDFIACGHNTIKTYEDGSQPPHRFLYWENTKDTHTIDDFILGSFFHSTTMVYRNIFRGNPPSFFRSKWSCDIFMNIYCARYGNVKYFDEDMAVYRAHAGGSYSTMPLMIGTLFHINGLRNYNRWLGYIYLKPFALQISRRCQSLVEDKSFSLPPLTRLKYRIIGSAYKVIFKAVSRFPLLDPAVFWYGEPHK